VAIYQDTLWILVACSIQLLLFSVQLLRNITVDIQQIHLVIGTLKNKLKKKKQSSY